MHIREAQFPILIVTNGTHKGIRNAHRNIEVRDLILIRFAGNKFLDIGMIHAQDTHIGATPGPALGDLTKGMIVDAQESNRPGGLSRRRFDERTFRPQAREGEAVAAAGLLDQGRVTQGLENTRAITSHIIGNRQNEAGGQLSKRRARTGKRRRVGKEFFTDQQTIIFGRTRDHIAAPSLFNPGDMIGHAPEHFLHAFRGPAIVRAANIAAFENLPCVIR